MAGRMGCGLPIQPEDYPHSYTVIAMSGIRFAWCRELDAVLTARAVKREFLALDPRPDSVSFFCQNPECLKSDGKRTRVTCVNYKKAPSEQDQSVVVHYRQLDEHIPTCPDFDPEEADEDGGTTKGTRKAGLKAADAFDVFDPAEAPESDGIKRPTTPSAPGAAPGGLSTGGSTNGGARGSAQSPSSTRFIEDLAAIHVQAKTDASADALLERGIRVQGRETVKLRFLFSHVQRGKVGRQTIWYGGAQLKRYGKGFALQFRDEVEGMKLSTYISPADVAQYRYQKQLADLLVEADLRRYVTADVWGTIEPADVEGKLKLQPSRIQHLAIILGPPKTAVLQADTESSRSRSSNK